MAQFTIKQLTGEDKQLLPEMGIEIHAISSGSKPISSWTARDGIQECRECCGGHGYLKGMNVFIFTNIIPKGLFYKNRYGLLIPNLIVFKSFWNWIT